jgi:hypothetical protein
VASNDWEHEVATARYVAEKHTRMVKLAKTPGRSFPFERRERVLKPTPACRGDMKSVQAVWVPSDVRNGN